MRHRPPSRRIDRRTAGSRRSIGGSDPARGARYIITVYRAWQLGAVVYYVGGNVLEITPPLVITDEEVDRALEVIGQAIGDAVRGLVSDEEVAPYTGW